MVDPQASQFWRFAVKSGLLDDEKLRACWEQIPPEKRTADAIDRRLARRAVDAGMLTVWQAQQLLTGRATGFKIDRYLLLDLIGQGGMGRVYLAKDTRLGRRVAIKVLSKERTSNPRAITRFQREAKVGAQLQHENLVRIYDEGEAAGIRYLVMEYIDGKNVAQLIGERGSIPWPEAARLARQVALGLEHAQQKGLIHRDVNPANILVDREGTAKLTDLGLAIDLADEANVTRDGATVGTFDYISPEQARHSREVDSRADIYSLGCTLYHMVAGRVPFPTPSLPEKLYAHQLREADPLTSPQGDVPEGLAEVVRTMMRKQPEERYASPLALAQALEPFAEAAPGAASSSSSGLRAAPAAPGSGAPAPPAAEAPAALAIAPAPGAVGTNLLVGSTSDPEALFNLDIGPEVPLTASLSSAARAKPKPRPKPKDKPKEEPEPKAVDEPAAKPRRRLSPRARTAATMGIGLAVVVAAVVAIAAVVAAGRKKLEDRPTQVEADDESGAGGDVKPTGPISVAMGRSVRPASSLAEAIAMAARGGGQVLLSGPAPIRMASTADVRLPSGRVTIRGVEGRSPALVVDVAGGKPLLTTSPGSSLRLEGLRVVARYQEASQTPLIDAGGSVALARCVLVAEGACGRSVAVRAEGTRLAVEGCLVVGFDRAIDLTAFPGSEVKVTQSVLAHAAETDRPPGWAIRVGFGGGQGNQPRKVTIDRATVRGGGLLEVVGFPGGSALIVALDHVAVQAPALLAWSPRGGDPAEGWAEGLKWTGKGNLYNLSGDAWVLASASTGSPAPNAPRDLEGWKAAVGSDKDSSARAFALAAKPTEVALDLAGVEPGQFALEGEGTAGVGADPARVGPVGGAVAKKDEPKGDEPAKADEPARKAEARP